MKYIRQSEYLRYNVCIKMSETAKKKKKNVREEWSIGSATHIGCLATSLAY